MKVTVLNPEEVLNLFHNWGVMSSICYDTHTQNPAVIGKHCLKSGHFSGSRSQYIEFQIDDCPRFLIDQLIRSEVGVAKNVQSLRYVNKYNADFETPRELFDNPQLLKEFFDFTKDAKNMYQKIHDYVKSKEKTDERASEQARYSLPISIKSSVVIAFTVEGLINYCHKRLCIRTEDIHRELANLIATKTLLILPELGEYLVPQCEYLTWCPEEKSCGKYSKKC